MAIIINDPELERRLAQLGEKQPVPAKKTPMAIAILKEHTRDLRRPHDWRRRDQGRSTPQSDAA